MSDFLVVMDIPAIKKYVFMTHKLKEIQGGSIIIDSLNRVDLKKKLNEHLPSANVQEVYANGGSAQFIVSGTDNASLVEALGAVSQHVRQTTCDGASLAWGVSEGKTDYQTTMKSAQFDLLNRREQGCLAVSSMHVPFSKECTSCSRGMAVEVDRDGDWLCPVCVGKRNATIGRPGIWDEFTAYLIKAGLLQNSDQLERPNDFTEIGAACKGNYMAIVYADGNAMGRFIREIDTRDRFRVFADIIDSSIKQACFRALAEVFQINLAAKEAIRFPADILLLGGDDMLVALPADKGLSFAFSVSNCFESQTGELFSQTADTFFNHKLSNKGCTISLGIAMGKSHHPFRVLLSQAEELLGRAKAAGSKDPDSRDLWAPSYMDFHLTTQSHQLSIDLIRDMDYSFERSVGDRVEKFHRTFRPYRINDVKKFFDVSGKLKRIKFPKTKLNGLYRAALSGRSQAMLDTIRLVSRCKKDQRRVLNEILGKFGCREFMPWSLENRTFLTEMVEFYDLVGVDPTGDQGD